MTHTPRYPNERSDSRYALGPFPDNDDAPLGANTRAGIVYDGTDDPRHEPTNIREIPMVWRRMKEVSA